MAKEAEYNAESARARLLAILESEDCSWRFTERVEREGKIALRSLRNREPRELEIIEYIVSVLKTTATLRCAPQGDLPGATGIAWQLTDLCNVFIKMRILEARIGEEYVLIQSLHESNPQ